MLKMYSQTSTHITYLALVRKLRVEISIQLCMVFPEYTVLPISCLSSIDSALMFWWEITISVCP
ncbi:hypothetical protein ANAPC3_00221 [Anaplasma phagocytophilum]|nr:hypothetical protein ANAPC4_00194 [Anaplasma phagocytophilum]SBO30487.1 hypothetical protein ANAPC3_00221 [Anaplasma phagocytophilum]SBO31637.1 hypothetical protein ANAPC2_00737 [Anaplasma phagocytophilum]